MDIFPTYTLTASSSQIPGLCSRCLSSFKTIFQAAAALFKCLSITIPSQLGDVFFLFILRLRLFPFCAGSLQCVAEAFCKMHFAMSLLDTNGSE